jgi:hypothetical protein
MNDPMGVTVQMGSLLARLKISGNSQLKIEYSWTPYSVSLYAHTLEYAKLPAGTRIALKVA